MGNLLATKVRGKHVAVGIGLILGVVVVHDLATYSDRHPATAVSEAVKEAPKVAPETPKVRTEFQKRLAEETPARDAERERMIATLRSKGLIGEVKVRSTAAEIEVTPRWLQLPLTDKKMMAGVLMMFAGRQKPETMDHLKFVDIRTGKKVAMFDPELGLDLDD
jgi:hypothetical protein